MREAEENINLKMEIDVLVPIPRSVPRDFTSLEHLRQWQKRNDIDGSLYCFAHREYLLNEKGEWEQFTVIGKQGDVYKRQAFLHHSLPHTFLQRKVASCRNHSTNHRPTV